MNQIVRRPRRLRSSSVIRDLVAEVSVSPSELILPIFIREGLESAVPLSTLPGIFQYDLESAVKEARRVYDNGVKSFMIFGVPSEKDSLGSQGYADDNITSRSIAAFKDEFGDDALVMADLCLDEFTDHGHCGVLDERGCVANDSTLELYGEMALSQAKAGVDFVGPSGMMDGQVGHIRSVLDMNGFSEVGILAYSIKYASGLYGPFREAVNVSIANGGDRKGYQQDFRNVSEAMTEVSLDIAEGADIVMVKPAGMYLDIIRSVRDSVNLPVAAYQVSGEYSMIKAAGQAGYVDEMAIAYESLIAIKRAGASSILTYFAHTIDEILSR
ncbi:MAG: porphobilinogen synthase [Actinomycetota bacterium]|nr:porphobilinogen synthase [Actinomycetota bacterium]